MINDRQNSRKTARSDGIKTRHRRLIGCERCNLIARLRGTKLAENDYLVYDDIYDEF